MAERLQKIISQWGIASRREAEQLIVAGRVRLNHAVAVLGQKADPEIDQIEVDGVPVHPNKRPQLVYLLLNKPAGIVSTCHDPQRRKTVLDLLPDHWRRDQGLHPVGRLDFESTGALLVTNDGALTFALTHPRHHLAKTYRVWVQGCPGTETLEQWRQGVDLSGKRTLPAKVRLVQRNSDCTELEIILREGRNRQIRRVAEQLGYPVLSLHRVAIGPIHLGELLSGHYRLLDSAEVCHLKAETAITPSGYHAKR